MRRPSLRQHARALGRRGGRATSQKKATAARINGLRGGRRPKFSPGDRFVGHTDGKPAWIRGQRGSIIARGPGRGEYTVQLDIGELTYVMSHWIHPDTTQKNR